MLHQIEGHVFSCVLPDLIIICRYIGVVVVVVVVYVAAVMLLLKLCGGWRCPADQCGHLALAHLPSCLSPRPEIPKCFILTIFINPPNVCLAE